MGLCFILCTVLFSGGYDENVSGHAIGTGTSKLRACKDAKTTAENRWTELCNGFKKIPKNGWTSECNCEKSAKNWECMVDWKFTCDITRRISYVLSLSRILRWVSGKIARNPMFLAG